MLEHKLLLENVFTIENCLPLTVERMVDLQSKWLQQMQLFILHVAIEGYRLRLLSGYLYLRMIGDLTDESNSQAVASKLLA